MSLSAKTKRRILILAVVSAAVAIWVLGDYLYSRVVESRLAKWEATIERGTNGVQSGAESFSVGSGDTALLLVHGFNDTPKAFEKMAPALAERGYFVKAVRLPGFGVPVDQMRSSTHQQWVAAVRQQIVQLSENHSQLVVVAHSLGGAVAIGYLIEDQSLVDGAVLLAPAIDVANRRSPVFPTRFWRRVGDWLLRFSDTYESPYDRNDTKDPAQRNPQDKSPYTTRNIVQETFSLLAVNQRGATRIRLPLLMILTREDQVTDWAAAESYFDRIRSAEKHLKFYDSSGHALTVDYDWEKIVDDIDWFVQTIKQP